MAAALYLEGKALSWFQWCEHGHPIWSWIEFKQWVIDRFRATEEEDLYEQFCALYQDGTVMEYREKFEFVSGQLTGITEEVLEGNFIKGLKPEIRVELHLLRLKGLGDMMDLAQKVEDHKGVERLSRENLGSSFFTGNK